MRKKTLFTTSVVFNVLAIVALIVLAFLCAHGVGQAKETVVGEYNENCVDAITDVERPGFEVSSGIAGRTFVTALGEVFYWPKQDISGLGEKAERTLTPELVGSLSDEMKFNGYKVAVKDVLNAVQLSYGLSYNGDNVILIHGDGTVTWLSIYKGRAKLTKLDNYSDIVSATQTIDGNGVPVVSLIARSGKHQAILLNDLVKLRADK